MPSAATKREVGRRVAALVAYFANRPPDSLKDADKLGDGGYGLSKYHLEALAKPLTHISGDYGGTKITIGTAARAKTLGDLVTLVVNAIP
jgi:hypothetical protein